MNAPSPSSPFPLPQTQPVLTAEAMRAADRFTIEDYGLPGFTLMESAGRAAADAIAQRFGPMGGRAVAVFCGAGNNGGDGLVVARQLFARGAHVRVVLMDTENLGEDPARNLRLLEHLVEEDPEGGARLRLVRFENLRQLSAQRPAHLHIDALLGTGLTSELRDPIRSVVRWLNEQAVPVAALDLPTGLHSDTGQVLGEAVRARLTVTMAARKAGLLLGEGPQRAGRVEVAEIGIPRMALRRVIEEHDGCARRLTNDAVRAWLPRRAPDAHKYSVGLALVVAGTPGMTGAPIMAASAAARAGAGYVACACHESTQATLAGRFTAITTIPLPASSGASAQGHGLDPEGAMAALEERLGKARALLVGPGLGRHPQTQAFVRRLLVRANLPAVIDADGLNAISGDWLAEHAPREDAPRWILTPHAGEFMRLVGEDEVDLTDRIRVAQRYAQRWRSVLLLKGMPSVVAAPEGRAFVAAVAEPALATAGTGDVLAGLCTGLLAQGLTPLRAALCGLHLGGAAAEHYIRHRGDRRSMTAEDLIAEIPRALRDRFRPDGRDDGR